MSLAMRVRDFRYSKGWGPDELANRAAISRTALYQIESGKTELPRAGTLRRIASALDVSMETLLGHSDANTGASARPAASRPATLGGPAAWSRGTDDWYPAEGAPMSTPTGRLAPRYDSAENPRFKGEYVANGFESQATGKDRELVSKFQELLGTPFGEALARIVEETYRLLPQHVGAIPVPVVASVRGH